jgi:hypothetical protein
MDIKTKKSIYSNDLMIYFVCDHKFFGGNVVCRFDKIINWFFEFEQTGIIFDILNKTFLF